MVRGNKNCNFHGKGKQITPPSCTNCQNSRLSHLWLLHFWSLRNCHLVISGTVILFIPGPDVARTITNIITWITREMPSIITVRALIIDYYAWTRVKMTSAADVVLPDDWVLSYSLITPLFLLWKLRTLGVSQSRQSLWSAKAGLWTFASIHWPYPQETTILLLDILCSKSVLMSSPKRCKLWLQWQNSKVNWE